MSRARVNRRFLVAFTIISGVAVATLGAALASAQPSVEAGAWVPPTGPWVIQTITRPATPLDATATAGSGATTSWARCTPGTARARAAAAANVGEFDNAAAYATYVDYFHLYRPGLADNSAGDFIYNFYLSGTMRVLANTSNAWASVSVYANSTYYGSSAGMLQFGQDGAVAKLIAVGGEVGGGGWPMNNIFAGPGGALKVYATVGAPVGGYYTLDVRLPVRAVFRNFPCNQMPSVDDWSNRLSIGMNCSASRGSSSDFSSTFALKPQNPILPDPEDARLPSDGWTYTSGSGDIALPSRLWIDCATGTGKAFFSVTAGQIEDLSAHDASSMPSEGMPEQGFADGFFSLEITGLPAAGATDLTVVLPGPLPVGMDWWHPGAGNVWTHVDAADNDGDGVVKLQIADGGPEDHDGGTPGNIHLVGGFGRTDSQGVGVAAFTAAARVSGVDLTWRAEGAAAAEFDLTARLGDRAWSVPVVGRGEGSFGALDENAALTAGGRVAYELRHVGQLVGRCEVTVAAPPEPLVLRDVAPNPFNPRATITFVTARAQRVRLEVFDLRGRLVARLADGEFGPGAHEITWDGRDRAGEDAPSGGYLVRLQGGTRVQSRLVSLVR